MSLLIPIFQTVSLIFAVAAVATGVQAVFDPVGFSHSFGLPIPPVQTVAADRKPKSATLSNSSSTSEKFSASYVSLMGIRQLATGIILLTFAYQGKWAEMATILSIIGVVVAGVDGIYLARSGANGQALFHAIPGAAIAFLAAATAFTIS